MMEIERVLRDDNILSYIVTIYTTHGETLRFDASENPGFEYDVYEKIGSMRWKRLDVQCTQQTLLDVLNANCGHMYKCDISDEDGKFIVFTTSDYVAMEKSKLSTYKANVKLILDVVLPSDMSVSIADRTALDYLGAQLRDTNMI